MDWKLISLKSIGSQFNQLQNHYSFKINGHLHFFFFLEINKKNNYKLQRKFGNGGTFSLTNEETRNLSAKTLIPQFIFSNRSSGGFRWRPEERARWDRRCEMDLTLHNTGRAGSRDCAVSNTPPLPVCHKTATPSPWRISGLL